MTCKKRQTSLITLCFLRECEENLSGIRSYDAAIFHPPPLARQQSHFLINLGEQSSPVIAAVAFIILS
jgi:hypothetical protein